MLRQQLWPKCIQIRKSSATLTRSMLTRKEEAETSALLECAQRCAHRSQELLKFVALISLATPFVNLGTQLANTARLSPAPQQTKQTIERLLSNLLASDQQPKPRPPRSTSSLRTSPRPEHRRRPLHARLRCPFPFRYSSGASRGKQPDVCAIHRRFGSPLALARSL